jgi:RNA polymerase sigma factor (sigma-70 family)
MAAGMMASWRRSRCASRSLALPPGISGVARGSGDLLLAERDTTMDEHVAKGHDSSSSLRTVEQQRIADQVLIDETQNSGRDAAEVAFVQLLAPYERLLRRRLKTHVAPDVAQADDLLNEVRFRLWRRLRRKDALTLQPPATFSSYLYRITNNVVIEYHKRHTSRLGSLSLEAAQEQHPGWEPASHDWTDGSDAEALWQLHDDLLATTPYSSEESLSQRENIQRRGEQLALDYAQDGRSMAYQALLWVQQPQRNAYILFKLKGHSQKEIAEQLGMEPNKVSSWVYVAHEQFRAFYALLLWEEEGASADHIARALKIATNQVETYVERGRFLRARNQRRSDRVGGR